MYPPLGVCPLWELPHAKSFCISFRIIFQFDPHSAFGRWPLGLARLIIAIRQVSEMLCVSALRQEWPI